MSIRRVLAGAALGAVASVVSTAPAGAQPVYPPVVGGLTVSATSGVSGSSITLSGEGFAPDGTVTVTDLVQGIGVVRSLTDTADPAGIVTTTLLLTVVGTHTITMAGADPSGVPQVLSATVVISAAPKGGAGGLPNTGANVLSPLVIGGVLVAGGAGLILAARRRRRRGDTATSS